MKWAGRKIQIPFLQKKCGKPAVFSLIVRFSPNGQYN